ncbi:hypothetical protein [Methanotorris formicicus]|uniref:Uncharacterized protein n=1 Tax=Methanotorris formicicus Mc-S-70 TaxID=647171 RepID=H1KXP2_9EURY|nr:hypothetical protein [Methanotorris formicicus]EHP88115.1 hypothetical protein MetfoDRAFT_0565 [Methanotorris formicicus Mc-S-70]
MLRKCFTTLLVILLLASPVSAFFSFDFSISQSRAVAGATIAAETIADTMVSNYIDENHPEYSDAYTVVSLIFDPTGKVIGKLSSKGLKYADELYKYLKKEDKGKGLVNPDAANKIFDKDLIEELAKKEGNGYSPKTVAKNTVKLLEEGVEPGNINKLFKDAVENDKKLGWIDNRIETLEENGVDVDTINDFIEKSSNPYDDLRHLSCKSLILVNLGINKENINKIIKNSKNIKEIYNCKEELKKLKKMGISKENLNKIVENLKDIKDISKIRKTVGDLKRRKISKEAINKLIEKGYDLEKAKE